MKTACTKRRSAIGLHRSRPPKVLAPCWPWLRSNGESWPKGQSNGKSVLGHWSPNRYVQASDALQSESDPLLFQTYQHPADGHRIPPLAATKAWHLALVQFPRHSAIAHNARCPELLNHGCQSPCAQVSGNHVRQCTRCFAPPARTSRYERRIVLGGVRVPHCR